MCPRWLKLKESKRPAIRSGFLEFPEPFVFGVATSAYQIEGAANQHGRKPSIWDEFSHLPGTTSDGATGDIACDHYHLFQEDVDVMSKLNVKAYRFSISWSRILPNGTGGINKEGIKFYSDLIDSLLAAGIVPWVTLYHWDLPSKLDWLDSKDSITSAFSTYARTCFESFGDRVKHWITLNEPWCSAVLGYNTGDHAPGHTDAAEYVAGHHMLLAHAEAVRVYREDFADQNGQIGISLNADWRQPMESTREDRRAAERAMDFSLGWFAEPVFHGDYPKCMRETCGERLPAFTPAESALLKGSSDFFGLNSYSANFAKAAQHPTEGSGYWSDIGVEWWHTDQDWDRTDMGWPIVPWSLREILLHIQERYRPVGGIFITENGCACESEESAELDRRSDALVPTAWAGGEIWRPESGMVFDDPERVRFFRAHLSAVHAAISRGADVRGYFAWSLLDNFEWAEGYAKRFGIVRVDFPTQERMLKSSARFLAAVFKASSELVGKVQDAQRHGRLVVLKPRERSSMPAEPSELTHAKRLLRSWRLACFDHVLQMQGMLQPALTDGIVCMNTSVESHIDVMAPEAWIKTAQQYIQPAVSDVVIRQSESLYVETRRTHCEWVIPDHVGVLWVEVSNYKLVKRPARLPSRLEDFKTNNVSGPNCALENLLASCSCRSEGTSHLAYAVRHKMRMAARAACASLVSDRRRLEAAVVKHSHGVAAAWAMYLRIKLFRSVIVSWRISALSAAFDREQQFKDLQRKAEDDSFVDPLLERQRTAQTKVAQVMCRSLDEGGLQLILLRWHRMAFKERRQKQVLQLRQESEARLKVQRQQREQAELATARYREHVFASFMASGSVGSPNWLRLFLWDWKRALRSSAWKRILRLWRVIAAMEIFKCKGWLLEFCVHIWASVARCSVLQAETSQRISRRHQLRKEEQLLESLRARLAEGHPRCLLRDAMCVWQRFRQAELLRHQVRVVCERWNDEEETASLLHQRTMWQASCLRSWTYRSITSLQHFEDLKDGFLAWVQEVRAAKGEAALELVRGEVQKGPEAQQRLESLVRDSWIERSLRANSHHRLKGHVAVLWSAWRTAVHETRAVQAASRCFARAARGNCPS
ncbi:BGL1B [Symbiodinium pilosum]|uniref:beta-glucosidase n=1 Tax=Symbiodinium pilosum TaxID=2952 RepID=A0A812W0C3_SYMPI|nr:BGL1B [Symbiodinium pilosum]